MRSNSDINNPGAGGILKTTASTHSRSKPDRRDNTGSSGMPDRPGSTFNGKKVSNHQPCRGTSRPLHNGKNLEDAFWENKPLQERKTTSAEVLKAYSSDITSLRSGFFLQKLCLQNVPHGNRKVTPDQVIQEFKREPGQNNKYQLAIARFKAECCIKGLLLNGQRVTADAVVKDFPDTPEGKLGIARFMERCCLSGLGLHGQQITPNEVVMAFPDNPKGKLGVARFQEQCCLSGLPLNGQQVSPDTVANAFPDNPVGKLGIVRFQEECCLEGVPLNGQQVSPDTVLKGFQAANARLEMAHFKAECCLRNLPLNGQQVTTDAAFKAFPDSPEGKLARARFKAECCLRNLPINGHRITPASVIKDFQDTRAALELARFKEQCCLRELLLNGRQVTADEVVKDFQAAREILGLARFKAECCLRGLLLNDQQVTLEQVVKAFPNSPEGKLGIARFKADYYLKGLPLHDLLVTPDEVFMDFPDSPEGRLGRARFKAECCLRELPLNGQPISQSEVIKDYQTAKAPLELARFKEQCCLKSLSLNGQQVTPDEVIRGYPDNPLGKLGSARFKAECCLRGLTLDGQLVTPDAVVKDYQAARATLELAHFKAECCMRGLTLAGNRVTPDEVVKDFPGSPGGKLGKAHFKVECCLRGLALNGQQVTPDAVVKGFPGGRESRLGIARFKAECCLRGLTLNGQPVTPDAVVKGYLAVKATLELARFKEQCCLRGLALNRQPVTPDSVAEMYQAAKAKLALARFKAECCLRGLCLNNLHVTTEEVVGDYQAARARLELARFKAVCCLKDLWLNGAQVTPDEVVKSFPDSPDGKLGVARFTADCCLRGLPLNGQQVTPDSAARGYKAIRATLELARFKSECCLKGLLLNGQQVSPDAVVKDYERGGRLLERAIFYSLLALNARELNGKYLDNEKVLAAFNDIPGDHTSRQTRYLVQRLQQSHRYDETSEGQEILQQAWQILTKVPVKDDEQSRLQCILKFMAMENKWTIDQQKVSAKQVFHAIKTLRRSFKNSRLHFFFLAHCCITRQSIGRQHIHKDQVIRYLKSFPEGSRLRHALTCWFEECSSEACVMDELLDAQGSDSPHRYATFASQQEASVAVSSENTGPKREHLPDVIPVIERSERSTTSAGVFVANPGKEDPLPCQLREYRDTTETASIHQTFAVYMAKTLKQWSKTGIPDKPVPRLNALTLKTLEIIQEINGSYTTPPLLINGSYGRFLQNLCSSFNDIDIVCTEEASSRTLFDRLQALNTDRDSEIAKSVTIWPIEGCQAIKLPHAYNIQLKDGDLGRKAMELHVSVDARVAHGNTAPLAIHVPGVERPVWCLSFTEETRLLNDTLEYLARNLDRLTEQLQKGAIFGLARTLLFNTPQNNDERIYGLLMRCLLTLNKARQFIALHSEEKPGQPDGQTTPLAKEQQRLHTLAANLQAKLHSHVCRHGFEHRVNHWLSTTQPVNDHQLQKKDFTKTLLAMMHPA
ncbi:hypothetical protein [Endozoicomonas sp. GU-1]|uniref:hypothetical protein n=1 Tax=Endozoicomonas sp. GU-1 TaxID=3009078 RepID=UPI0022B3084C|nr:hypothetical protein [Endozoicomonas sp. GU-1]WBA83240.1 hypothetical protein O2T12_09040 [Endozoicomonas sp. GU-1]